MTTFKEVREWVKKYNMTRPIYFYHCDNCHNILISKLEKPPRQCPICRVCMGSHHFYQYTYEQIFGGENG